MFSSKLQYAFYSEYSRPISSFEQRVKWVNTWSETQKYTCEAALLDSAQAICVKKSRFQLLAVASLASYAIEHFE